MFLHTMVTHKALSLCGGGDAFDRLLEGTEVPRTINLAHGAFVKPMISLHDYVRERNCSQS